MPWAKVTSAALCPWLVLPAALLDGAVAAGGADVVLVPPQAASVMRPVLRRGAWVCASWVGPLSGDDGTDGAEPVRRALVNATRVAGCSRSAADRVRSVSTPGARTAGDQRVETAIAGRYARATGWSRPGQRRQAAARPAAARGQRRVPPRTDRRRASPAWQASRACANSRQLGDPCSGLVGGGRRLGGLSYHGGSREPRPGWARHHRGMMRADRRCARRRRPGWQGVNQLGVHQQHAQPQQRSH